MHTVDVKGRVSICVSGVMSVEVRKMDDLLVLIVYI